MMNPAAFIKLMNAKKQFTETHPKFEAFCNAVLENGIEEGTVIEVTVTKPGKAPLSSNIKVRNSDLELIEALKNMK